MNIFQQLVRFRHRALTRPVAIATFSQTYPASLRFCHVHTTKPRNRFLLKKCPICENSYIGSRLDRFFWFVGVGTCLWIWPSTDDIYRWYQKLKDLKDNDNGKDDGGHK